MRPLLGCLVLLPLLAAPASAQADGLPRGVTKVEAAFDPPEAKPGQTVTLKLTLHLADGYHTYPLKQDDKAAAGMVNKLTLPKPGGVVFVGEPLDPDEFKTKAEPELGIKELVYLPGTVTYQHKAVISPRQAAGPLTVKVAGFRVNVCDKDNCFPPKTLTPEATVKVLAGPAVAVEGAYRDEVRKAE